MAECEKRAVSKCTSVPRLPPTLVDVINVLDVGVTDNLGGNLDEGNCVIIVVWSVRRLEAGPVFIGLLS